MDERRRRLQAMKRWAAALLLMAIAGLVLSEWMGAQGPWAWVRAFCEAAAVGALADWFAVVALFRHPLGLPIPHTAVIPSGKSRLADNLADFVREHFLDPQALLAKLKVFDPAARLGQWLADPAHVQSLTGSVRVLALQALDLLDERAVRGAIQQFVVARLRSWDAAATGGEVLGLLTRDGRHQELFDAALTKVADYLDDPENRQRVSAMMVRYARKEWPLIIKVVNAVKPVDELADDLAERLAEALITEMQQALSDPQHAMRLQYEAWLQGFIERLKADPALSQRVHEIKDQLIEHPAVNDYVNGLWDEIRSAIRRDLDDEASALMRHLAQGLEALGRRLGEDPALREALNTHVMSAAETLAGTLQSTLTSHIAQTIKDWDERELVDQLELTVGRDLQFIRLNGTLVGGVIGLALHALLVGVVPLMR